MLVKMRLMPTDKQQAQSEKIVRLLQIRLKPLPICV